jgi:hypothetical protein
VVRPLRHLLSLTATLASLAGRPVAAQQQALAEAAERARAAWLAHDAAGLVGSSGSVVLQIPGADPSSPLGAAQATELLRRYLRTAEERGIELRAVRQVEEGRGLVELERRYVVVGTADERRETLFLGMRWGARGWVLVELRSAR